MVLLHPALSAASNRLAAMNSFGTLLNRWQGASLFRVDGTVLTQFRMIRRGGGHSVDDDEDRANRGAREEATRRAKEEAEHRARRAKEEAEQRARKAKEIAPHQAKKAKEEEEERTRRAREYTVRAI
uniref:Uncharacterized protein n=1 Tax=Globodera pallida TaxID=36090 RepID=A0A183CSJ4_GLOPA